MRKKSETLLKAIKTMSDLLDFQDQVHDLLNIEIYELQPSDTAGRLFDLIVNELLTEDGVELLNEFVFTPLEDYNEENPFVITEKVNGITTNYEIHSPEELCTYFENNKYFKE